MQRIAVRFLLIPDDNCLPSIPAGYFRTEIRENMNRKILILGAGNAQIDAIEYCKDRGFKVCGCSYTTVDNGIPYRSDLFCRLRCCHAYGNEGE